MCAERWRAISRRRARALVQRSFGGVRGAIRFWKGGWRDTCSPGKEPYTGALGRAPPRTHLSRRTSSYAHGSRLCPAHRLRSGPSRRRMFHVKHSHAATRSHPACPSYHLPFPHVERMIAQPVHEFEAVEDAEHGGTAALQLPDESACLEVLLQPGGSCPTSSALRTTAACSTRKTWHGSRA